MQTDWAKLAANKFKLVGRLESQKASWEPLLAHGKVPKQQAGNKLKDTIKVDEDFVLSAQNEAVLSRQVLAWNPLLE